MPMYGSLPPENYLFVLYEIIFIGCHIACPMFHPKVAQDMSSFCTYGNVVIIKKFIRRLVTFVCEGITINANTIHRNAASVSFFNSNKMYWGYFDPVAISMMIETTISQSGLTDNLAETISLVYRSSSKLICNTLDQFERRQSVFLFSKLINLFFGYFDPVNIF